MKLLKSSPGLQPGLSAVEIIPEKRLLAILKKLFVPVVFLAVAGFLATPVTLRCTRAEQGGPVNCVRQASIWGIIPLREQSIADLRGARVDEWTDPDNEVVYRVELLTGDGVIPLKSVSTPDRAAKDEITNQINDFVDNQGPGALTVTESGLSTFDILFMLVVFFLSFSGSIWKWIKTVFRRTEAV